MAVAMPNVENLPYHPEQLPHDTKGIVEALADVMRFDIEATTKRDEYTLSVLCGVILYQHLDRFQKMEVISMIRNGREHIALADLDELIDFCTDMSVQPRWWLWALSTQELERIYKEQKNMTKFLALLGVGFTFSGLKDAWKNGKSLSKGLPLFLLGSTIAYVQGKQLSNTQNELDMRTSKPRSSDYYK